MTKDFNGGVPSIFAAREGTIEFIDIQFNFEENAFFIGLNFKPTEKIKMAVGNGRKFNPTIELVKEAIRVLKKSILAAEQEVKESWGELDKQCGDEQ